MRNSHDENGGEEISPGDGVLGTFGSVSPFLVNLSYLDLRIFDTIDPENPRLNYLK